MFEFKFKHPELQFEESNLNFNYFNTFHNGKLFFNIFLNFELSCGKYSYFIFIEPNNKFIYNLKTKHTLTRGRSGAVGFAPTRM